MGASPRWITAAEDAGDIRSIDLGIVNVYSAATSNPLQLIPYRPGIFIKSIFFSFDGYIKPTNSYAGLKLATPNTVQTGLAVFTSSSLIGIRDTDGSQIDGNVMGFDPDNDYLAITATLNRIMDVGPLLAIITTSDRRNQPVVTWQPETAYGFGQAVLDSNGHLQSPNNTGGVSGSSEPEWNDSGGTTNDGSVVWFDYGLLDGSIHAYAEVCDIGSDSVSRPASMEFVQQPTNTVAEETILPSIKVRVLDQNGAPYTSYNGGLLLSILGDGALVGDGFKDIDPVTGIADWASQNLSITEPAEGYRLIIQAVEFSLPSITSDPFDVTAP